MEADPRADGLAGVDPPQRFTPGWLARWLARGALAQATPGQPLRCLDPACGGGRLLLALYEALRARGFTPHDALGALVGFDLDPNAAQVARWSLWMRASRETPHPHTLPTPLIFAPDDASSDLARLGALAPWDALARASHGLIAPAAFDAVVVNPPYLSWRHMAPTMRASLQQGFGPFSGDLYTAFLRRSLDLVRVGGGLSVLCQRAFLFITRDREVRRAFFGELALRELLDLGANTFPGLSGEKTSVVALAGTRAPLGQAPPLPPFILDLQDLPDSSSKERAYRQARAHHAPASPSDSTLPPDLLGHPEEREAAARRVFDGAPALARVRRGEAMSYWARPKFLDLLDHAHTLGQVLDIPGTPHKTADNGRFVRFWWEVDPAEHAAARWIPYAKGGPRVRWYGNLERLVDWSDEARHTYAKNRSSHLLSHNYWYREGITWSDLGGQKFCARWLPPGGAFDMAGPSAFVPDDAPGGLWFWLGLLNSAVARALLNARNATLHYQIGDVRRLPLPPSLDDAARLGHIAELAYEAVQLRLQEASWECRDPRFEAPALLRALDARDEPLAELLARAAAQVDTVRARLDTLQTDLDDEVMALYGLGSWDLPDDALDPPRPPASPDELCLRALDFTAGVAQGRYPWPDLPPQRSGWLGVAATGEHLWGPRLWAALATHVAQRHDRHLSQTALAKLRHARRVWFSKAPWHPTRQRWELP